MAAGDNYLGHFEHANTIIMDNPAKGTQYRFAISEFRDVYYIGVREWYEDFDGEYAPSNNGFTMPYHLHSVRRLFSALCSVLSKGEVLKELLDLGILPDEDYIFT